MQSLRVRIFLSFWLIIAVTIGAASLAGFYFSERTRAAFEDFDHEDIMWEASAALQERGREGLVQWLRDLPVNRGFTVYVLDPKHRDLLGRQIPFHVSRLLRQHGRQLRPYPEGRRDPQNLRRARPLSQLIAPDGRAYTLIVLPSRAPYAYWVRVHLGIVLLIIGLIVSGIVSYLLARAIVNPIRQLRNTALSLADGNLSARVGSPVSARSDELGLLARDFDSMADKLAQAADRQRELSRNISHELRSPLARLRVALELARRKSGELPEFDRINAETERLDNLIGQILSYTRMDTGEQVQPARVDLAELIGEVVENVRYECRSDGFDGVRIASNLDESATMRGYPEALTSAIENIVRNAVHHSPPAGQIEVRLSRNDSTASVEILDQGAGVDDGDLPHLFEPFFKTRRAGDSGTGLGLAIADRAVRLNGGTITAKNRPGGGLRIIITLPLD